MGRAIVRVGDKNSGGGAVISGSSTVKMNGRAIALDGSPVTCHNPNNGPRAAKSLENGVVHLLTAVTPPLIILL